MLNEVLNSEAIYRKVDDLSKKKNWSLYRLAKEANLSRSAIYNWRDNKSQPTLYLLECVSEAFKIPIINLLFDNNTLAALGKEEHELLSDWYCLTKESKSAITNLIKILKNRS